MPRAKSNNTSNSFKSEVNITPNIQLPMMDIKQSFLPEQSFKRSFTPLLSKKDQKAQLTFAGYKHSIRNDGSDIFLRIVFTCLDVTGKNPQNIAVLSNYGYSEKNVMGKLLKKMGYSHQIKESDLIVVDEDDEYGTFVSEDEDFSDIYDYFDEQKGLVFKGKLWIDDKNFYRVDVTTLEACLDKSGNQKRAYLAEEGISEKDLSIDIEAAGGDN